MKRTRTGVLSLAIAAALTLAVSGTAAASVSETYAIAGIEVWATPTVGTFVGEAVGSDGDAAVWRASIEHTVETQPSGTITGGRVIVRTTDLTRITGDFKGGTLRLIDDGGPGCGDLKHRVKGRIGNVRRSDADVVGKGSLRAILVHYRVSVFGHCIAYSASAGGTITLSF